MSYGGNKVAGLHQTKSLLTGTGDPVEFLGSMTGPSFTESTCSPLQVTWRVRPQCAKLDINSLGPVSGKSGSPANAVQPHPENPGCDPAQLIHIGTAL